ncbi:alpha/beta hydrolase [Actinomadura sp. NPDC047616]|uniref:alpha/beta fold hydrolase n=1 Tax=Actinomadura sp. NPDC047616 TaxID=3155914 RepID=UPI00340D61AB
MSRVEYAGGEQVHVVARGPADGPVALLTTGLGGAWFDWTRVVDLLAGRHRTIAFDRPGLGLSPAGHAPPSLRRDLRILEDLAEAAGSPVVPVAHSMAAFPAEALARLRPDLVAGLVLVDPSAERDPRVRLRKAAALTPLTTALARLLDATRLAGIVGPAGRRLVLRRTSRRGDVASPALIRRVYGRGTVAGTVLAENLAYREMALDLHRLRRRRPFPPVPLVVLTALGDQHTRRRAEQWRRTHEELAAMSPHGRQVVFRDARHMLMIDEPDAVAAAVAEVTGPEGAAGAAPEDRACGG